MKLRHALEKNRGSATNRSVQPAICVRINDSIVDEVLTSRKFVFSNVDPDTGKHTNLSVCDTIEGAESYLSEGLNALRAKNLDPDAWG